jgi:peptidoglycan/xylan/chitin deacetylase (PgdA/CDA1 family)
MLSVILISILIENIFLISDILAYGQQIKEKVITATEKGKRIGSNLDDRNNAITNSKPIQNNNDMQYDPTMLSNGNDNINKVIILTFGDTEKSQFTTAKPILDQYGFKASFFITCSYVDINQNQAQQKMSWKDILALQEDGQDIESKGITSVDLNNLSSAALNHEIGGSKQCLEVHGIKSPNIFAVKYGNAWNNSTVIDAISGYYGFADNGFADLMFLHCDGYDNSKQTDCKTYNGDHNGKLNYASRYSIREQSHNAWDKKYQHNDKIIFQKFVEEVNSGIDFNDKKGIVDAIPIVAYHIIDNSQSSFGTNVNLFAAEMKYLHDNGFKLIPMSDLSYDENTDFMYIR